MDYTAGLSEVQSFAPTDMQPLCLETGIVGGLLAAYDQVSADAMPLKPEHFSSLNTRKIFEAIDALRAKQAPVDIITVSEHLRDTGQLENAGGRYGVTELSITFPSTGLAPSAFPYYVKQLIDRYKTKRIGLLHQACGEMGIEGRSFAEISDYFQRGLDQLSEHEVADKPRRIADSLPAIDRQLDLLAQGKLQDGISTGYRDVDALAAVWREGTFNIIAARPSMGKTAFMLNTIFHGAMRGHRTMLYSLETTPEALLKRLICLASGIKMTALKTGRMSDEDWERYNDAKELITKLPIDVSPQLRVSPALIASDLKRARKAGKPYSLVYADYLQLMTTNQRENSNRNLEVGEMTRQLKLISLEEGCSINALCQLSRGPEMRQNKRPILSDLRDSGSIEQDADIVAMLYRDEYYNSYSQDRGTCEIIIAKNRDGETGTAKLSFDPSIQKFTNKVWSY